MKRWIALLLAIVMIFSFAGCNKKKTDDKDSTKPLTPVGTYEPGNTEFDILKDKYYDYFLGLLGYGFITESDTDGKFNETELIKFALVQLSYAGYDGTDGYKKSQIDRVTRRFFSQKTENLDTSPVVEKNDSSGLYYPTGNDYTIGQFMLLRSLKVEENGLCTALFDRIAPEGDIFSTTSEDVIKANLIEGNYDDVGEHHSVEVRFRERETAAFGYYIQIEYLRKVDA